MLKVKNRKVIGRLATRSLFTNRLRVISSVLAIALTAMLFTTLLTVSGSMLSMMQTSMMRQVGGSAHGSFKYLTQSEYNKIAADKSIQKISYSILIGLAENPKLAKTRSEIRYAENEFAKWAFSYPQTGRMPEAKNEVATSSFVLNALGIPHELGQELSLLFSINGESYAETFVLSGFWAGDEATDSNQIYLSRSYINSVAPVIHENFIQSGQQNYAGYINADLFFSNSIDIQSKLNRVLVNAGLSEAQIFSGVNWSYIGSSPDIKSVFMLLLVIAFLLLSGYLIIFNIFYISVSRDVRFYGLLKTIGSTKKQIKRIIRKQALNLSAIGIPIGLLLGFALGTLLLPIIINKMGLSLGQSVVSAHPLIFIAAILFTLLTVWISCLKPGKLAAKISPVEATRFNVGQQMEQGKQRKIRKASIWNMAKLNVFRKPRQLVLVVCSLSLSIILLNSAFSIANGFDMEKFLSNYLLSDFSIEGYNRQASQSLDSESSITPQVAASIAQLNGIQSTGRVYLKSAVEIELSERAHERIAKTIQKHPNYFLLGKDSVTNEEIETIIETQSGVDVYGLDAFAATKLDSDGEEIDWDAFSSGNYIIVNRFASKKDSESFYKPGEFVRLKFPNGKSKRYQVLAIANLPYPMQSGLSRGLGLEQFLPSAEYQKVFGEDKAMRMIFDVEDAQINETEAWLENYCKNTMPNLQFESRSKYIAEFKSLQSAYLIIGAVLSSILALIGLLNFINTFLSSIIARRRELAVMQSVGMSGQQLQQLLLGEGLIYVFITVATTILLGIPLGYLIVNGIAATIWFYSYFFTIKPILYCLPVLLLVAILVPCFSYRTIKKKSIVERLGEIE